MHYWMTRCGQDAVAGLNEALWAKAAGTKLLRVARVRADTTVIPANVAYPTDSGLAAKAVGKLIRTVRRVQAAANGRRRLPNILTCGQFVTMCPPEATQVLPKTPGHDIWDTSRAHQAVADGKPRPGTVRSTPS